MSASASRTTSTDYRHPFRPWPIALANRLGRGLTALGGPRVDLSEAGLLACARRRARLKDFGDESFLPRMRVLLESLERESALSPVGRFLTREKLVGNLVNRLRIAEILRREPELRDRKPAPLVVIAGLQRTGTTMLHRLLAADPDVRHLASWEALNPAPLDLDAPVTPRDQDPRIRMARMAERALAYMAPDFFAIHPVEATAPEEDVLLLDLSFLSTVPEATYHVPHYAAWLEAQDHRAAYRELATTLVILERTQRRDRWVLKTPHHLEHLDALLAVFPDATIVQTHRDPARVVASFCSMIAHGRGVMSDAVDPEVVGRHWLRKQVRMVTRAMEVRDQLGDRRFVDVQYAELVAEPIAAVRRIYERLGTPLGDAAESAMRAWIAANPQHRHGRHRYALEDFGLTGSQVEQAFSAYRARFAIPREERS